MGDVRRLGGRERDRFADLLAGLTDEQWTAATLCAGWSVRDVAAHTVSYLGQSVPALTANMIRARGNVDRLNARILPTGLAPVELVAAMSRGSVATGAAALYGGRVALIECVVHQQDIRRPLDLRAPVSQAALRVCLNYARISPVIGLPARDPRCSARARRCCWR